MRRILYIIVFTFSVVSCTEEEVIDPCLASRWLNPLQYEIKLAVSVSDINPLLPGAAAGSRIPADFVKMKVNGTIEKFECDGSSDGILKLGNSYIDKQSDITAPLNETGAYWIGHVVYVYEFDNDEDYLDINLAVEITMADGQSYMCSVSDKCHSGRIDRVPGELYYYVLNDIYSDSWKKLPDL